MKTLAHHEPVDHPDRAARLAIGMGAVRTAFAQPATTSPPPVTDDPDASFTDSTTTNDGMRCGPIFVDGVSA